MAKKTIITARIDDELKREIEKLIIRTRKTQNELIEEALKAVVNKKLKS